MHITNCWPPLPPPECYIICGRPPQLFLVVWQQMIITWRPAWALWSSLLPSTVGSMWILRRSRTQVIVYHWWVTRRRYCRYLANPHRQLSPKYSTIRRRTVTARVAHRGRMCHGVRRSTRTTTGQKIRTITATATRRPSQNQTKTATPQNITHHNRRRQRTNDCRWKR